MSKFLKVLFLSLVFLGLPIIVNAENIEVTSLETSIKLNKNNTAVMKETYELYFINNSKTFDRTLDSSISTIHDEKTIAIVKPKISGISMDEKYTVSDSDKKKLLNIKLSGKKDTSSTLKLKYKYDFGKDEIKDYDEFYYNIVSNFDSIVSDVQFEIILPDENYKKIAFYINGKKVKDDVITYDVEDNILTGYLNKILNENDVLSVRIDFIDGYFKGTSDNFNYFNYLALFLPLGSIIVAIMYWFKYAKGNKVKRKYSYYPPYNFDSAEIGYLYKGKTDESDLGSLIIYLANKGYLNIEENDDGYKLGKENSFNFIKNTDYKGRNAAEKIIFNGIFKDREKSTLSDVEYGIATKLMDAKTMLDNNDNKKKIFNIDINKSKLIIIILIALSVLFSTLTPVKEFTGSYLLVPVLTFTMLFGLAIISIIEISKVPKFVLGVLFIGGTSVLNVYSLLGQSKLLYIYIISDILVIIATLVFKKLPQRTKFGNEKLGEVEGFRVNLISMNINKLKELIEEDSNYYYDMVPYTMVFDILDNWIELGKKLELQRPLWHITKEEFDIKKEGKFFKNVVFTSTQVMIKGLYVMKDSQKLEFKRDIINTKLNDN